MSSRDTSDLYTGATSATTGRKPTLREVQVEKKEQDYNKLKPAADVVLELIEEERKNVLDLRSFVLDRISTEQEVNTELLARKLYLGKLNSFEAKIKNTLNFQPRKKGEASSE